MKFLRRLQALFQAQKIEGDMTDEMRLHLELQEEANLKAGLSPEEARYAALREFGNLASVQERAREQRGWVWVAGFWQDVRHGARLLRKNPGFTATAVTVLGLGIGANAAVFNFVHSLLLAPPTYARPNEILRVASEDTRDPRKTRDFSYPAYRLIRERNTVFSDTLASALLVVGVGEKGDTRRAAAAAVSANYFSVLGVAPVQGRVFLPDEGTPGRATPVVVASHAFWKKHHFDPALLGSSVLINGRSFTVVGIMPEGFTGTTALFFTELWLPLGMYDLVANHESPESVQSLSNEASTALMVVGRLKPGLTPGSAALAFRALAPDLEKSLAGGSTSQRLVLSPLSRFASSGNDTTVAWVGVLLLGMAAVVLLVACLNLANMLLARGMARRKEIALRLALGGGRARIVRQLLTEGFLLALLGGAGGLLLSLWASDLLTASLGRMIPIDLVWTAGPEPALLAATFGFSVLATLVFALGPALKLSRGDILPHLKEHAGEDRVPRRSKFLSSNPVVSVQVALSLALLTAAILFMRSAARATSVGTGLNSDRVFLLELDAALGGHDEKQALDLYRRLGDRLGALPGVASASVAVDVPLGGLDLERQVQRAGEPKSARAAKWNGVGDDYFRTVGLPLLRGRAFTAAEATQAGGPPVAIINEVLARQLWPDGDALGQHLQLLGVAASGSPSQGGIAGEGPGPGESFEVVGIVPATRHNLFESAPDGGIYLPFVRGFQSHVFFQVKFLALPAGSEGTTTDLLRRAVGEVDASLAVLSLQSFAQHLNNNIQTWIVRAGAALFSAFGGLALCLAVVGVYGVNAYAVARRTREIGIRMALGARPEVVQRMILRDAAVMLISGLLLGFLLSLGVAKIVSSLLYQVGALDPVALTVAPAILAATAFLACWLPARRATKVDPVIALRAE
jgi:predicted permease